MSISKQLFNFKNNSLGSAVICILSALAYKKKISDGSISVLKTEQAKLLACLLLIASADYETTKYFLERKVFSSSQLHSFKAKILMEGFIGSADALFARSLMKVSNKRMQLNILHSTEEIFKRSVPLQWMHESDSFQKNPSIEKVPSQLWEYELNIEEQNVLKKMKEFWSIELKGPFRYQEGEHKKGLKVEDFVKSLDDIN